MHIYPLEIDSTPWSVEHRCLEHCYTKLSRSTGRCNPPQLSIDTWNTTTPNLADQARSTGRFTPQLSIDAWNTAASNLADAVRSTGRSTNPLQSIIDACNTTTPNKFHIYKNAHICMADGPPTINHRSMEHHYTK